MFNLEPRLTQKLLESPESGMGYQHVEIETTQHEKMVGIAYNAELLLLDDEPRSQLRTKTYESLRNAAARSEGRIRELRVISRARRATAVKESAKPVSGEAKDAPVEMTAVSEVFKRFSAYVNDRRVQADGSLLPGTFATTEADATNVTTGTQAVSRYALANPQPASQVFTSRPQTSTAVQRGRVAPANGQPGGGVEVIFTHGTQPGTTTGPIKIPD